MRHSRRRSVLLLILASFGFQAHAQLRSSEELYWDYPINLSSGRFLRVGAGNELMYLVWQETDPNEGGGENFLSMAVTADGRNWRRFERFAGPLPFIGREVLIYSMAVTQSDVCYIAIAEDPRTLLVYRTDLVSREIELLRRFEMPATTLSPMISIGADGGVRLFVIRDARAASGSSEFSSASASAIFLSRSDDGIDWEEFRPLLGNTETDISVQSLFQFLPNHTAAFGTEYLVYQVYFTDEDDNLSNQLYIKTSIDNGVTWSDSRLLTGFRDPTFAFSQIDNQRPNLTRMTDTIGLVWERGLASSNPQVYFAELSQDGEMIGVAQQVTQARKDHRRPELFEFVNNLYILWFDNQSGVDHLMLGRRQGPLWIADDLTADLPGRSSFGTIVEFESEPFVFFENRLGEDYSIVSLKPDESIAEPPASARDFADGERYRRDSFTIQWSEPPDSSGIAGYAVSTDRDPAGVPPPDVSVPSAARSTSVEIETDGEWFIHLAATDRAGNWSEASTLRVTRDTTPPRELTYVEPEIDEGGYLASNSFTLRWNPPADDDVAGYSYAFQYLYALQQVTNITNVSLRAPPSQVLTLLPEFSFQNIDNGLWSLSVAPIDTVGNRGREQVLFVHLNKYVPVTYVTTVSSRQDDLGRVSLTITGRGFSAGGLLSRIIFDRDRIAPYDFQIGRDSQFIEVISDRIVEADGIEGVDEGEYFVGVTHPVRGTHFVATSVAIDPSGQVKFGDFASYRPSALFMLRDSKYAVPINVVVFLLVIALLAFLVIFSSHRMVALVREGRFLRSEVHALITGELTATQQKERIHAMRRRGMGLRIKFALFTIILVISIVLIVAFPLGIAMTGSQERILAEGLQDQTRVLLESLRRGAENFLSDAVEPDDIEARLQLGRLPRQRGGVGASRYVIITGQAAKEQVDADTQFQDEGFNFVWAHDDPAILDKIDMTGFQRGASRLSDPVSELVPSIANAIDEQAALLLGDLPDQIQQLADERSAIATRIQTDIVSVSAEEIDRFTALGTEIPALQQQLLDQLESLDSGGAAIPSYDPNSLSREITEYIFYKPIIFPVTGERIYFRGLVRVGITTEPIIASIRAEQTRIIVLTGIISLIGVGIGIVGALVLSSIIIIPIRRLVAGVETIRDTEDKEQLKSHVIDVRTRDEISTLAETVNQMTRGLAEAAAANKDLILGKDTPKMFVPLEQDPSTGRKLTTARDANEFVEFFGYYEGAKGVSGDYFDFTRLDDKHYAIIKCDVAGKGVPASLIMVEVATIFLDYFRNWSLENEGIHLDKLAYRINDLVEERGFKGRFAALMLVILNIETGSAYFCNAGDKYIHLYEAAQKKTVQRELPESPASGVFPSDLVEMGTGFSQVPYLLKAGDSLLLFTDGLEEDKSVFRDAEYQPTQCAEPGIETDQPHDTHVVGEGSEELGIPRIHKVINAVFGRGDYSLEKYHHPNPSETFTFDFSTCTGTVEEAVLALAAVDKVFRVYKPPGTGPTDRVRVDRKIVEFLQNHFKEYDTYFQGLVPDDEFPEYVHFPFLKEDAQYDDLTILGVRKV